MTVSRVCTIRTAWFAALVCAFAAAPARAGARERGADARLANSVAARDSADTRAPASRTGWAGEIREEHRVIAALLRTSRTDGGAAAAARARVSALEAAALAPAFDILVQGRVPAAGADDTEQVLSLRQREVLLQILAAGEPAEVRAVLQARLGAARDEAVELAALRVYGAVGDVKDLARLAACAPRAPDDTLTPAGREALGAACAGILARHPEALETAGALAEAVDAETANVIVLALGDLRDARAIAVLFRVARRNPTLAQTAIAMVPRIGSSRDASVDAEFAAWLRSEIRPDRTEWTRAIVRALGELDDGESAPELIALLGHAHKGIADAALAALRRMSRNEFPPQAALWDAWYQRESKWYDRERPRQRNALERGRVPAALEALRAYSQHAWRRTQLAQDVCGAFTRREAPVRELACEVLGGLGSRVALPALVETLGDPTTSVATAAWHALQRITGATLPNDREAWSAYVAAPPHPAALQSSAR